MFKLHKLDRGMTSTRRWTTASLASAALLAMAFVAGCDSNNAPTASQASNTAAPKANAAPAPDAAALPTQPAQLSGKVEGDISRMTRIEAQREAAAQAAQQAPPPGPDMVPPPIRFEPESLEFGLLKPGEERTGTVEIRNLSDKPLRIVGSRASCKCTSFDLANQIIAPGGTVPLTATMKPDVSPGPKKAKVRIGFEGYGQIAEVDINAEVSLAVHCDPAYIATGGTEYTGTIEVKSLDEKPFTLITADAKAPDFVDFDPVNDTPRNHYTIRYDLTMYSPDHCEEWPGWYMIETDHPEAPVVDMRIRDKCTIPKLPGSRRWLPTHQREIVGLLKPGESREFVIPMLWAPNSARNDLVNAVVTSSDQFTVELLATDYSLDDPEITVRVTPKPEVRGLLYGVIELHSTLGNSAEYLVMGRVAE